MRRSDLADRSQRLAARVDALAAALHASGVAEEQASRLLETASAAVLQALTLELLLEQPRTVAEPISAPAVELERPVEPAVPLAA